MGLVYGVDVAALGLSVAGFTLNTIRPSGVVCALTDLDGWFSGPGVTVPRQDRLTAFGEFAQSGRRGGRVIVMEGWFRGITRAAVLAEVETLPLILADGGFGPLTVTDRDGRTLTATVQLLQEPDVKWESGTDVRFQLQFLAPSPYRFGSTSTSSTGFGSDPVAAGLVFDLFSAGGSLDFGAQGSSGSVSISNPGTAPASVRFTVVGPTPVGGFVITPQSSGRPIRFLGSVPSGSSLVFDGASGTVVINGTADRLGDTIISGWPTIPAGGSDSFAFTSLGSNTAAVMTASAVATYY